MSETVMCLNCECILKDKCERYTKKPDKHHQKYLTHRPNRDRTCDHLVTNNLKAKDEMQEL